jgi:hypothetical protein
MTRRRLWIAASALVLATVVVGRSSAQTRGGSASPPPAARTTASGVYTAAQATSGEEVYMTFCVSCHPTVTYTGPAFKLHWEGRPLSDLYEWVSEQMPKNEPGTLTPKQAVEAVAYILRLNKMPAGKTELPPDFAALRRIRIEIK